jgi:CheY-like chemotaxis protein
MFGFKRTPKLHDMKQRLPRMEIVKRARIAILDDETPEMLQDLRDQGFAVDHLVSASDPKFHLLADGLYDLLLLDFGGIGGSFGDDDGLDVLRFLKRVNPALRIIAFTGRTFDSSRADFFRKCDSVLKKDAGIRETMEEVEAHLADLLTPGQQVTALRRVLGDSVTDRDFEKLEKLLARGAVKPHERSKVTEKVVEMVGETGTKIAVAIGEKAMELGALYISTKLGI